jgi:predicted nucleotidyltransferase
MSTKTSPLQFDSVGKRAVEILIQLAQPKKLWLFGSRARNQAAQGADYDFALEGPTLASGERWRITEALEQLPTLRQFDVVWLDAASETLREEVSKEGICLYER